MTWSHGGTVIVGDEPSGGDEPAAYRSGASPRSPSLAVKHDPGPAPLPANQPGQGVPVTHNDGP